jgi:hypothetical protein
MLESAPIPPSEHPGVEFPRRGLIWKSFDDGRLILAATKEGYFELVPGNRFRHIRVTGRGMHVTDLGPCTGETLEACMYLCEHFPHASGRSSPRR